MQAYGQFCGLRANDAMLKLPYNRSSLLFSNLHAVACAIGISGGAQLVFMNKLINPSPQERTPEQRGTKEKHSPWTAPRDKKKKRSTYDHQLPAIVDDCHQNHGPGTVGCGAG